MASGCLPFRLACRSRRRATAARSSPGPRCSRPRTAASRRSNSDPGKARAAPVSSMSATSSQLRSAGPGRGTACSTRCGRERSVPSACARSCSSPGEALACARSSSRSLIAFRSSSRWIRSTFLIATAVWPATEAAISRSSASIQPPRGTRRARNPTSSSAATSDSTTAEPSVPGPHRVEARRAPAPVRRASSTPSSWADSGRCGAASGGQALHSMSAPPPGSSTYSWQASTDSSLWARLATAGSRSSRVAAAATARARSASPSASASRRRVPWYRRAFSIAPATRLAECMRKSESACVNSLGASACSAITPITCARLVGQRHRHQRLVLLLLGLRHHLDARVVERPLGQEHRLVVLGHPAGQALAGLEAQPADQRRIRLGHRPQHQRAVAGLDEVDEAGVAVDGLARSPPRSPAAPGRGRASTTRS